MTDIKCWYCCDGELVKRYRERILELEKQQNTLQDMYKRLEQAASDLHELLHTNYGEMR